ncbi:MAG: SDR family NAD(P)-dependent oxidoreductase, partial [Proteobacteria bacterium]|nr:SDR family NAD(P)-dependent oxidoreductase [Pseudomonadota bacterium]
MERLKGRVAVVTGSGQGMGLAIAHACAREGAKVAITDINDKTIEAAVEE